MHTFSLGVHKLMTSAYSPSSNDDVERVYHTMAKVLAMVCNEHQNDWDAHLSLGVHKLMTSAYSPSGNAGVERVYHTMAKILAMVCNEHRNDWDVHLSHLEYAYNNSTSAVTDLASNEVSIGRLPRLPLAVFGRSYDGARQSLDRDYLVYCDLARERQQRAYEPVRE